MRIHIIGGSGAGKTFISEDLCKKFKLKTIDLDKMEWVNINGKSQKRDAKEKNKLLKEALKEDNIIIEGVYYKWCDPSFKKCEYIFFINTPLIVQQYRIIRRSIRRKLGLEESYYKETFKSVTTLLKWNIQYNTKLKKEIFDLLANYKSKVYNVSSYKDILNVIGGKNERFISNDRKR